MASTRHIEDGFDERFMERLEQVYEQLDDTVKCLERKWIFQLNRFFLYLLVIICRTDLAPEERTEAVYRQLGGLVGARRSVSKNATRRDPMRHFRGRLTRQLGRYLSGLVLIIYIISVTRVTHRNSLQYRYDTRLFRYNHLPEGSDWQARNSSWSKVQEAYVELRAVGAPFIHSRFGSALLSVYMIISSLLVYISPYLLFNRYVHFHFRVYKVTLNWRAERRTFLELICNETEKFVASSRSFNQVMFFEVQRQLGLDDQDNLVRYDSNRFGFIQLESNDDYRHALEHHDEAARWLRQMALNGSFRPLNWDSRWIMRIIVYWVIYAITSVATLVIVFLSLMLYIHLRTDIVFEFGRFIDWMGLLDEAILIILIIACLTLYIGASVFVCLDQIIYINRLTALIDGCATNIGRMASGDLQAIGDLEQLNKRMNYELLHVLIHHKLFMSQSRRAKGVLSLCGTTAAILYLVLPMVLRLHQNYFEPKYRHLGIIVCLITAVLFNLIFLPICRLHGCSFSLYKSLTGLLAHIIELQSLNNKQLGHEWKLSPNKHLVWLMQKELGHPIQLTSQFITRSCGVSFEYSFLIKMNFWFGVVLSSLLENFKPEQIFVSLDNFLKDPFKLLQE